MVRKVPTSPRKRPRQQRSRATVEAILEATARVLAADGLEAASTNRVAAVAGVSVGSLYQYFPNREALVHALFERHVRRAEAARPAALGGGAERPIEADLRGTMRAAVDWHLAMHAEEPALHQELTTHAQRILGTETLRAFERFRAEQVRGRLEAHRDAIRPRDLALAAFIVATCLEAVTHAAVVHHPEMFSGPDLASELTELLVRFLER